MAAQTACFLVKPFRSFSNKGTQTLIGNLVSAGTTGDLSRFTAPKSNALLADQNWELRNAKIVGPINRLREMLWDFTYLCWKMTNMTQNWEVGIHLVACWLWNYSKSYGTFVTFV